MRSIYRIVSIENDGIVLDFGEGLVAKSTRIIVPRFAREGDYIKRCEHNYFDVVDIDGNYIYRGGEVSEDSFTYSVKDDGIDDI
ncbi:hypothetical protein FUAX_35030 [Fulvitalea axinellae]|uniref:Uncharacterized protein n=1 Tax=Fulvitalea axinellae TaxID=1182444 RepID=A0AAU9CPK9_9BACT|nr:hypothetical protein FUAX_35030 [Fulvitalea axinellae]